MKVYHKAPGRSIVRPLGVHVEAPEGRLEALVTFMVSVLSVVGRQFCLRRHVAVFVCDGAVHSTRSRNLFGSVAVLAQGRKRTVRPLLRLSHRCVETSKSDSFASECDINGEMEANVPAASRGHSGVRTCRMRRLRWRAKS